MATQIDLGAVVPIGKGDWNIDTTYERTNIVRHNSAAWVCKVDTSIGVEPTEDSSDWYLLTKDTSSVTSVNGQKGDVTINIETVETPEENDSSNKIVNIEWVNNKITPIKSELSSTTSIAEDAKNIATLVNSTANTALTNANNALSNLGNYLPITGGTITGTLAVNDWFTVQTGIRRNDARNELLLCSGSTWNDSPSLSLYGSSHHDYPGDFILRVGKDSKQLIGKSNGQLTWNGKHIVRSINNIGADTNGNISLSFPYLPFNGSYTLNLPTTEFGIGVGTSWDNAPSFTLYGTGRTDGNQGMFSLRAKSSSNSMRELIGRPSGQLTWEGRNIVRSINNVNADANGNVNITNIKVSNATYADSVTASGYQPTYNNISNFDKTGPYNINIRVPTWGSLWFVIGNYAITGRYNFNKSGSFIGFYSAGAYILNENVYAQGTWPELKWTTRAIICIRLS